MGERGRGVERDRALGNVGGVVADALDVRRDAQAGEDLAQVARHRSAQRQQHHVVADPAFGRVDGLVVGDDPARGAVVAAIDHVQRGFELDHGDVAHLHDLLDQVALLLVVALDDVLVGRGRGHGCCPESNECVLPSMARRLGFGQPGPAIHGRAFVRSRGSAAQAIVLTRTVR